MPPTRRRESLSARLSRSIGERIETGAYPVGERLPSEQDMVAEFGVSRTVVREAIADLRANGLVTTVQGSGAYVARPEKPAAFLIDSSGMSLTAEIVAALELRIALESEAAMLAARRRTDEHLAAMRDAMSELHRAIVDGGDATQADLRFHRVIAAATGNPHFPRLFDYLGNSAIPRSRLPSVTSRETRRTYLESVQREHEQIHYAIERRDPEAARAGIRLHLAGSRDRLLARLEVESRVAPVEPIE